MFNHITGIDHVLIAVADLDHAAETYVRLGFALTPRGGHPEWGTSNHCLMFARDYLELIGVTGKGEVAERVARHLARRGEGCMAVSLNSDDGAATYDSLVRQGVAADMPRSLSRQLTTPDGMVTPLFSIVSLPEDALPGIPAFACQHITPELLRRPEWLRHPNGATAISSITAVVDDPDAVRGAYERVFGPGAATPTDNTVAVHTGHGLIFLCRPDELTQLHPEADLDPPPTAPAIVAVTLLVADTEETARVLATNGVDFSRDSEGTIRVPTSETQGVFLEFAQG